MHRKHLLPGFDDRSSDEAAIEQLTAEITDVSGRLTFSHLVLVAFNEGIGILSHQKGYSADQMEEHQRYIRAGKTVSAQYTNQPCYQGTRGVRFV